MIVFSRQKDEAVIVGDLVITIKEIDEQTGDVKFEIQNPDNLPIKIESDEIK